MANAKLMVAGHSDGRLRDRATVQNIARFLARGWYESDVVALSGRRRSCGDLAGLSEREAEVLRY
jgi:hypothetical protein